MCRTTQPGQPPRRPNTGRKTRNIRPSDERSCTAHLAGGRQGPVLHIRHHIRVLKQRRPRPQLCDDAAGRKHVHRGRDMAGATRARDRAGAAQEPLRREAAAAAAGGVEEVGEVSGVLEVEEDGLVRRKVGEKEPVPGGEEHVLGLEVAVPHAACMQARDGLDELEGEPQLVDAGQERADLQVVA